MGKRRRPQAEEVGMFLDVEAEVDSDEDPNEASDEDGGGFIVQGGDEELSDDGSDGGYHNRDVGRRNRQRQFLPGEKEEEDLDVIVRRVHEKYSGYCNDEEDDDVFDHQQALLPSVRDPKLWLIKCADGREREIAACLMQKYLDEKYNLKITSAIALEHLRGYLYIEAEKEAHVREACKGFRNIYLQKITMIPIQEMADVLSVQAKRVHLSEDAWVRLKISPYKGDLARVVDIDNVRQRVTVKLIPRIDLQALANKLEGKDVIKKTFQPPPRFLNFEEARKLHIRVERVRDSLTGFYFDKIGGLKFKDGFLYKTLSVKSICTKNITPTFDELEKFRRSGETEDRSLVSSSKKKKSRFVKGDLVLVRKGDLQNLKGCVEKVEEECIHIKPEVQGLPKTVMVNINEICKYFEPGNHVNIVAGTHQGASGMVVRVEQNLLIVLSDSTKAHIRVFGNDAVKSSEVTVGAAKIGGYELHDLVLLNDTSFGIIIGIESDVFQVLKGVTDKTEVASVRLREIKSNIQRKSTMQDRYKNTVSVKDIVKIIDGPFKGKQGLVEHIHRGVLFIRDRNHHEHCGFVCAKSCSCVVVGGSSTRNARNVDTYSRFSGSKTAKILPSVPSSAGRFARGGPLFQSGESSRGGRGGRDASGGVAIKICHGPYKGYRGRILDTKGHLVRVELESQMRVVTVDRKHISDRVPVTVEETDTPLQSMGCETPVNPSRTPLRPLLSDQPLVLGAYDT